MSQYDVAGRDTVDDTTACALQHGAECARGRGQAATRPARPATRPARPAIRLGRGPRHDPVRSMTRRCTHDLCAQARPGCAPGTLDPVLT